ncbi:RNA polymerase sigma factor [Solirubrobacter ginsenosidimutans]|uniref:RNA polymerase sigma factor n=1 Tax=Solirubrobacter ginsenosidimutans TaxID=490573 RepID=A0A9X3MTG7_9ACTN|nr:RNA polymerase sigma factor [Solirubrobacter ginsenosidimutans]MDA0162294.1 RNA polymerase sigma factor [Solirubrobacter ginsenosidimutans]
MDDDSQLQRLHLEHAGAVRAYVRRRIGADEADEVVADVFVIAWRRLGELPPQPRTWLLGTARRVLANRRRTAKRQRALYERLANEAEADAGAAATQEPGDGSVLRALASLSANDREVLLLVSWDGLSHQEAGEVLGVRDTTVAMRVHRARRRLERALERTSVPAPHIRATQELSDAR